MTTPTRSTVVYTAPCPVCGAEVTWLHHSGEPFPQPRCPRPTCIVQRVIEA